MIGAASVPGRSTAAALLAGIFLIALGGAAWLRAGAGGEESPGKPFPRVQAVPLPDAQVSFQLDGAELLRYHHGERYPRPFWYPLIGPAGRPLTRMNHPRDPEGHSHHRSIWVAHNDVGGVNFWGDATRARIAQERVLGYEDGPAGASMQVRNRWIDGDGKALLLETRTTRVRPLPGGELLVDIEIELAPAAGAVVLGKTPFGLLGVRVAKTMGVNDGGGKIRNSEGGVDEKEVLWKRARWVDYSGKVTPEIENGVALMDHPSNPRHPTYYHVRNDGWMGTSFCYEDSFTLEPEKKLSLRYRLYAHRGGLSAADIDAGWERFAKE